MERLLTPAEHHQRLELGLTEEHYLEMLERTTEARVRVGLQPLPLTNLNLETLEERH